MTSTIAKPSFREVVAVTTMNLDDSGLQFSAQRIGPTSFAGLRQADYGQGFRMPTMPELVHLVYASLENREYSTAKNVIQTLRQNWLTGNTGIRYAEKGMYVQDNPEMKDGRIVMDEKVLEGRLGSQEVKGVVFSNDLSVRFTPYGFKRESQSASELAVNPAVIAFAGGEEEAEALAKSSKHYSKNPWLYALSDVKEPQTRVAGLGSFGFGDGLYVFASDGGLYGGGFSFGVSGSGDAEGVAPKNK